MGTQRLVPTNFWYLDKLDLFQSWMGGLGMDGQSSYWTAKSSFLFLTSDQHGSENQITPRGWIFSTMIFYNLKNSDQDLFNEGSNFILSSLELGH